MKKLIFLLAIISANAVLFTACKGTAGPAGPAGPAGAAGPAGVAGPAGPAGSANVIYSAWTPVPNTWTGLGTNSLTFNLAAPGVTANILNQGVILMYINYNTTQYRQLPTDDIANNGGGAITIDYAPSVGNLGLRAYRTSAVIPGLVTINFRYILIPGGVAGSRITSGPAAGYTVAQVKAMTYEQITALFNIPANGTNVR